MAQYPSLLATTDLGQILEGATGQIYDVDDLAAANPLNITDLSGVPIEGGRLVAAPNGVLPRFRENSTRTVVSWVSGPHRMDIPCLDLIPPGGSAGQVLTLTLSGELAWADAPTGGGGGGGGISSGDYWNRTQTVPVIVISAAAPWPTSAPEGALIVRLSGTGA